MQAMNLPKWIIRAYLYLPYGFRRITHTGSFGPNTAQYLHHPVQTGGNSLKKALLEHHVKQFHESSCSVATVVSVVNAIRKHQGCRVGPIDQADILEKVKTGNWKKRMGDSGDNGRRGLPLALLGEVVRSSLDAYQIPYSVVETVTAEKNAKQSESIKKVLQKRLLEFEKKGDCLLIAHFDQGAYVKTLNIPHISPVGGFDLKTKRVTVLDVDPMQQKPYDLPFAIFYKGLSSNYHHIFEPFGYGSGGYIFIKLS